MDIPVFGKTVTFANLSGVTISVCPIVPLDKSGIDRLANRRCCDGSLYGGDASKDRPQVNLNYPPLLARLMDCRIVQTLRRNSPGTHRTPSLAGGERCSFSAIGLQNSLFIRLILIRGHQIHTTAASSFLKIKHKLLNVFCRAFAGDNSYYQTMLRIIRHMIPVVSLSAITRHSIVAMVSLFSSNWASTVLGGKGHKLIMDRLGMFSGKARIPHYGVPVHADQPLCFPHSTTF